MRGIFCLAEERSASQELPYCMTLETSVIIVGIPAGARTGHLSSTSHIAWCPSLPHFMVVTILVWILL
jgi:hypothetical protein